MPALSGGCATWETGSRCLLETRSCYQLHLILQHRNYVICIVERTSLYCHPPNDFIATTTIHSLQRHNMRLEGELFGALAHSVGVHPQGISGPWCGLCSEALCRCRRVWNLCHRGAQVSQGYGTDTTNLELSHEFGRMLAVSGRRSCSNSTDSWETYTCREEEHPANAASPSTTVAELLISY